VLVSFFPKEESREPRYYRGNRLILFCDQREHRNPSACGPANPALQSSGNAVACDTDG
jgi:hypothetical protein